MGFDTQRFMQAEFQPRTADVRVVLLKSWFGHEEATIWTVRGMTASEFARSMEAAEKNKTMDSVAQALAVGNNMDKVNELRRILGLSGDVPDDTIRRMSRLEMCSVSPLVDLPMAVKLADAYPMEFIILTNKIAELTTLGMDLKKPGASGETTPLEI